VSIVINTALGVVKGWLGLVTGSLALLADAFHTFSDSGTSIIVVFGFRLARKPADQKHPFGHGRFESIASIVIAVLLGVRALEMGKAGVDRILHPQAVSASGWVIALVFVFMILKELLAEFSMDLGRLIGSDALLADAWHHRSDVFATGLVIVSFFGSRWGVPWLDGAMGMGVAAVIAWAAVAIMNQAVKPLVGEYATEETYGVIAAVARSVPGVRSVHDIVVHRYGLTHVISLHIEVSDRQSPLGLHALSEKVEDRIAERFPGHAIVHIDPVDRTHKDYARIQGMLEAISEKSGGRCSFHDLRIAGEKDHLDVVLDVTLPPGSTPEEAERQSTEVERQIKAQFPNATVHVNVEPAYIHY
jgi:cation diffusion facilitator family transporter